MFDLDIEVHHESYLESTPTMMKFIATADAGWSPPTDIFLGPFAHFLRGGPQGRDLFQAVDWQTLAPQWPSEVVSPEGVAVTAYQQVVGFAYNTELLDASRVPRTAEDVVRLASEVPIASTKGAACFPFLASDDVMGRERLLEHLQQFGEVKAGLINPADVDSIANGEFAGVWLSPATNFVDRAQAAGAPVAAVAVRDAAVTVSWDMAMAKNTASPYTATLWMYFMNTPEAQQIAYRNTFADNMLIGGSRVADTVAGYESDGVGFVHFTNRYGLEHPEAYSADLRSAVIDALGV
jgi:ABC-type Fe3+ transport system substrate-binding protein